MSYLFVHNGGVWSTESEVTAEYYDNNYEVNGDFIDFKFALVNLRSARPIVKVSTSQETGMVPIRRWTAGLPTKGDHLGYACASCSWVSLSSCERCPKCKGNEMYRVHSEWSLQPCKIVIKGEENRSLVQKIRRLKANHEKLNKIGNTGWFF